MSPARRTVPWWRVFLGCALTMSALLAGSAAAGAHTELLGSNPADGATVATSPAQVTLTFTQDVQPGFTSVTVVAPDGTQAQGGGPVENGSTVSVPVRPLSTLGVYTIGYRVLSADGHPVEGSIRFSYRGSPTPSARAPVPTSADPTTTSAPALSDPHESSNTPLWPWAVGIVVLLAAGVITALRLGRAR